jgi:hypothetical protein
VERVVTSKREVPFAWDKHLERIETVPARGDNDNLREWITAHLTLRYYTRVIITGYRRHPGYCQDGAVVDPATELVTGARYGKEDVVQAAEVGDVDLLRDALAQIYGDVVRPYIKHPKRGSGKQRRARKVDLAEADYYFIRRMLERKYREADGKRLYGWFEDVTNIIADFHGAVPDSLRNRVRR